MGMNDLEEQLRACHAVNVENEETNRTLAARNLALEHENVRLESALAERLDRDRHGTAALERDLADARARLARLLARVDPRVLDPEPITPADVRAILDEATAEPVGAWLDPDEVEVAALALHGLAGAVRLAESVTPGPAGHSEPFAARIDDLAARLENR